MRGLGRRMPITMVAFAIGALSVIGLPPLGGTWSKWYLLLGTLEAGELVLLGVLILSTLLNVAYLMPIPVRAFLSPAPEGAVGEGIKEAPVVCVVALVITAAGAIALFFNPGPLFNLMTQVAGPAP
jgi:multicomponent Na+:H+ antiporter subunit D